MLTLPACHTEQELDLAHAVAGAFESDELHVFWSERSAEEPGAVTAPPALSAAALAIAAVGALVDALATALAPRGAAR